MQNVYKRGKSFVACVQVGGRRIRRSFRTKTEADACVKDLKQLGASQRWGDIPKDVSWTFFKMKHAELTPDKNEQTKYRDRHAFAMLEECFPIKKLRQVTPELLESLKGKLLAKGYHRPAINRALTALKAAMRKAEAWKYISTQIWNSVSALKTPMNRLLFYSLEELNTLKSKCHGYWLAVFMLGYEAGLRPSEKAKLEVGDIHWNIHKLHVHNSKGGKSRWIPMTDRLEVFLRSLPMGQRFVLGDDMPSDGVRAVYWRKLVKKAKLKGSEYTLRHTFASHLAMEGVPLIKIAELLGHSAIRTTLLYAHLSPESVESSIKKLPNPETALCTPLSVNS
jgi:integrase